MDVPDISPMLKQLDGNLKDLKDALKPVLSDLEGISSTLPLLDRAKLHVLMAYAIQSTLFSALHLNGVDARNHAIFTELTRIKQYYQKIRDAETPPAQREATVNTQAAMRFIKKDLSDDKEVVEKIKEKLAKADKATEQAKAELEAARARKRDSDAMAESSSQNEPDASADGRKSKKARKHKGPKQNSKSG